MRLPAYTRFVAGKLDDIIVARAGKTLQASDLEGLAVSQSAEDRALVLGNLGATTLLDKDLQRARRTIAGSVAQLDGVPTVGGVADAAALLGVPLSSLALIDVSRREAPPMKVIDARIREAHATLAGILLSSYDVSIPPFTSEGDVPTKIAAHREAACGHYQIAKGAMEHVPHVAEAQLELAAAHALAHYFLAHGFYGLWFDEGDLTPRLELKLAQNRLGLVVQEFGRLAKQRGDLDAHASAQIKALRWYFDATSKENVDHTHRIGWLNAAGAYAQLGDLDRGIDALHEMLRTSKDEDQRDEMKRAARANSELVELYRSDARFDEITTVR
jgi:hypothetical protein